jgi:hypothetical protein
MYSAVGGKAATSSIAAARARISTWVEEKILSCADVIPIAGISYDRQNAAVFNPYSSQ